MLVLQTQRKPNMTHTEFLANTINEAKTNGFAWFTDSNLVFLGKTGKARYKIVPVPENYQFENGAILLRNRGKIVLAHYNITDSGDRLRIDGRFYASRNDVMALVTEIHPIEEKELVMS